MSDGNEIDMLHTLKLLPESSQRFTNLITAPIDLAGFLPVAVLGYFLVLDLNAVKDSYGTDILIILTVSRSYIERP
jgi:hypothetical protein